MYGIPLPAKELFPLVIRHAAGNTASCAVALFSGHSCPSGSGAWNACCALGRLPVISDYVISFAGKHDMHGGQELEKGTPRKVNFVGVKLCRRTGSIVGTMDHCGLKNRVEIGVMIGQTDAFRRHSYFRQAWSV